MTRPAPRAVATTTLELRTSTAVSTRQAAQNRNAARNAGAPLVVALKPDKDPDAMLAELQPRAAEGAKRARRPTDRRHGRRIGRDGGL